MLATQLTDVTYHMFSTDQFARMKPSAFIINMARGPVIDEAALLIALTTGQIAGAGLDVFAKEPLPADSPLWDAPNVIITPHATPRLPDKTQRSIDMIVGQYRALPRGTADAQRDHQKGRLHAAERNACRRTNHDVAKAAAGGATAARDARGNGEKRLTREERMKMRSMTLATALAAGLMSLRRAWLPRSRRTPPGPGDHGRAAGRAGFARPLRHADGAERQRRARATSSSR